MESWRRDLIESFFSPGNLPDFGFEVVVRGARELEFEFVAYGFQHMIPASRPKVTLLNNYPDSWKWKYDNNGYLDVDPVVCNGRKAPVSLVWTDRLFSDAEEFWEEAKGEGISFGWSRSIADPFGSMGMISFSRSFQDLTMKELSCKVDDMLWLAQIAHGVLSREVVSRYGSINGRLSERQKDVLKWTADGKSAQDISEILSLSVSTVNFHITNINQKLNVPNKTAAVLKAMATGVLG